MTRISSESISEGVRVSAEDFTRRLTNAIMRSVAEPMAPVRAALIDRDYQRAKTLLAQMNLGATLGAQDRAIRSFMRLCALIGASALGSSKDSQFAVTGDWPKTVDTDAVNHFKAMARAGLDGAIRKAEPILDQAALAYRLTPNPIQNAAPLRKEDNPFDPDWLAGQINKALRGEIKRVVEVGSNLAGTRVSAYGMLHEATARGVARYRVDAVLDERTTDICQHMHGKTFPVGPSYQRTQDVLQITDVERIKRTTPFLSLEEIQGLTNEELQERGFSVPPFHFLCRSVVTLLDGSEPPLVPVPDKPGQHTQAPQKPSPAASPGPDAPPPPPPVPEFPDVKELDMATLREFKVASEDVALTIKQVETVSNYTSDGYAAINSAARRNEFPSFMSEAARDAVITTMLGLDRLMDSSRLTKPVFAYRGLTEDVAARMAVGKVFQDDGFMSVSASSTVATNFISAVNGAILHIMLPNGTTGLWAEPHTMVQQEFEFILPRGTQLRIIGETTAVIGGKTLRVIKAVLHGRGAVLPPRQIGTTPLPPAENVVKDTSRRTFEKFFWQPYDFREVSMDS